METNSNLARAAILTAQLEERRDQVLRLFGESKYLEQTGLAKERIRECMAAQGTDNPLNAAISYCNSLAAHNPGKDVSTAQQFVLCAAADMAAGR